MSVRAATAAAAELTADIVDLAQDGRGLARVEGKVTFVRGALPGERVRYALRRHGKQADEGALVAVETPSPGRVAPACPHFGLCGGCSLQHLSPAGQVAFKQKQLLDALARIGKVAPDEVAPPVTGPAWGYRRRARLSVKHVAKKGGVLVGFREADSPYVAQIESCAVLDPRVGGKLRALAQCVGQLDIRTLVPQIEVAATADAVALVFRMMQPPQPADLEVLRAFAREHAFTVLLQTGGLDTVTPLDPPAPTLTLSPDGSDLELAFRATDFVQVNDAVNRQMTRQALDWMRVAPGAAVLELFSGLGNFSLPLARAGAMVTAVEGDAGLVARARENAARNGLSMRVEQADLFAPDPAVDWLRARYDAALLDPPRAGAREVLPHVADAAPRILYVSCHPGTLARDAAVLVHERGYRLARAGILDMFPHTSHVESMALFEKG